MGSFKNGKLMLMHETRIFYFKACDFINDYNLESNNLISIIINVFTTRKYRLLWSLYLLTKYLNKSILFALILSLFFGEMTDNDNIFDLLNQYWPIYTVVGIEISLNILNDMVKIWIINRLSIYIEIILYIMYSYSYIYCNVWNNVTIILISIRFSVFIVEELIDYSIDLELHYDLQSIPPKVHRLKFLDCFRKCFAAYKSNYDDNTVGQIYIPNWDYKGSICVWTFRDTFKYNPKKMWKINGNHRFIFIIVFFITYGSIGLVLFIIVCLCSIIFSFIRVICGILMKLLCRYPYSCCQCQDSIMSECCFNPVY